MFDDLFARHSKVALMYSGGKDSLACLHLLSDYLDRLTVVWVNTNAGFPEIQEAMEQLKIRVPNFLEVVSDQPTSVAQRGYPSDVVPVSYTATGQQFEQSQDITLRTYLDCCSENIWHPLAQACRNFGFTAIISGQRSDETRKAPIKSGQTQDGVERIQPIEDWTKEDVLAYLTECGVDTSGRLSMEHSSLDCWNCTAHCNHSVERMAYIKTNHPEKYTHVVQLLRRIDNAVTEQMSGLRALTREENHGV
jgi:3'-phosphoadenosine 5'-phosphosulfate sulfotransferase (PAPS reductase)/FAD synthetase